LEPGSGPRWGVLSAINTRLSGKIKWQVKTTEPLVGGVLATAGDLLFMGEGNGNFNAYNSETGELLWQTSASAGVNAPPVTYQVDGKQYIAVAAGGNSLFGFKQGDTVMVFALPE
jgi:glucose dehydrogenase